jgi:hypothetical protein
VTTTRQRLLIDIRPRLLATSLARVLESAHYDIVLAGDETRDELTSDIAIVSDPLPTGVRATIVVSIPGEDRPNDTTVVWSNGEARAVDVESMHDLAALLSALAAG